MIYVKAIFPAVFPPNADPPQEDKTAALPVRTNPPMRQ